MEINTQNLQAWCDQCGGEYRPCTIAEINSYGDVMCDRAHLITTFYDPDYKA